MDQEKMQKIADLISKQLELKNDFSKKFILETLTAVQRFDSKHTEKGLGEYGEFGGLGVLIEMSKKYNFLKNYYKTPQKDLPEVEEEMLKAWEDISVFALMGKLVEQKEWKE
jgi:hypothetical protein